MPLRAVTRPYYQRDWQRYRLKLIERANRRCEICGKQFPPAQLTGAHMSHDPRDRSRVSILCFPCHGRHDSGQRIAMTRRTRAERTGQQWLWPEVQWSPYPLWQIPEHIVISHQREFIFEESATR